MQDTLKTNAEELARRWMTRGNAVPREVEKDTEALAPIIKAEAQAVMQKEIYSIPVPVSKSGRSKWHRTRELLQSERWVAKGTDLVGTNTSAHYMPRLTLGTPQGRRIVSPGIRSVNWQVQALLNKRRLILARRRLAVIRGLVRGR